MADEILNLNQAISDAESAFAAHKQQDADNSAVKDATISELQASNATKDARIAELEAQVGSGISPEEVVAATEKIDALTASIATP